MKKLLALFLAAVISFSQLYAGALSLHEEYKAEIVSFALFEGGEKIISSEEQKSAAIGSVSKIFTAVLTLKLCEEGLLSLEGRVTDYLPEFSMNDERYKEIKIEHLLNHTSGLFGSTMKNTILYKTSDSWNHDNFLSLLK
ncbi:MAG: serine hydrolase, partial [Clostridia bacterium]|nr:serine hydrolase [Clostridia bacterium]